MIAVTKFKPRHLQMLQLQDAQAWQQEMMTDPEYAAQVEASGPAWTLRDDKGVLVCMGFSEIWMGRSEAWALFSADAGRSMTGIVRAMRERIDSYQSRRIEAVVDWKFKPGHRLMSMLGFRQEGRLRAYLPDGRDVAMYSRVK